MGALEPDTQMVSLISKESIGISSLLKIGPEPGSDDSYAEGTLSVANADNQHVYHLRNSDQGQFSIENKKGDTMFKVSDDGQVFIGHPNTTRDVYLRGTEIFSKYQFKIPDNVEISGNQLSIELEYFDVTFIPNGNGAVKVNGKVRMDQQDGSAGISLISNPTDGSSQMVATQGNFNIKPSGNGKLIAFGKVGFGEVFVENNTIVTLGDHSSLVLS